MQNDLAAFDASASQKPQGISPLHFLRFSAPGEIAPGFLEEQIRLAPLRQTYGPLFPISQKPFNNSLCRAMTFHCCQCASQDLAKILCVIERQYAGHCLTKRLPDSPKGNRVTGNLCCFLENSNRVTGNPNRDMGNSGCAAPNRGDFGRNFPLRGAAITELLRVPL